jgi:hypothetical protein
MKFKYILLLSLLAFAAGTLRWWLATVSAIGGFGSANGTRCRPRTGRGSAASVIGGLRSIPKQNG